MPDDAFVSVENILSTHISKINNKNPSEPAFYEKAGKPVFLQMGCNSKLSEIGVQKWLFRGVIYGKTKI